MPVETLHTGVRMRPLKRVNDRRFSLIIVVVFCLAVAWPYSVGAGGAHQTADETFTTTTTLDFNAKDSTLFGYARLKKALKRYKALDKKGGWGIIPTSGVKLTAGVTHENVAVLRRRLRATDDLSAAANRGKDEVFDLGLAQALKNFQHRHGLTEDGVVGNHTLRHLNVPVAARITQIEKSLARFETLPIATRGSYVLVNIPDMRLKLIRDDEPLLDMRVIVGRRGEHRTPVFNGAMSSIVFNPRWYIPRSIALKEMLPQLRGDSTYLSRQNIRVSDDSGAVVDSTAIDWNAVTAGGFSYRFSQDSGDGNALGHVKFLFPNPYAVYFHDTHSRALFKRDVRDLSHGCVRVEKPVELAGFLLSPQGWDEAAVRQAITARRERAVGLQETVSVRIIYLTAWVNTERIVQFRDDVYGLD